MVGQSNMDGHGKIDQKSETDGRFLNGTLEWMVETYPDVYGKLKTFDATKGTIWKEREDVMITYNRQDVGNVRPESNRHGPLVAGYGYQKTEMGPELGFGWTVGDALNEKTDNGETETSKAQIEPNILLLKVAWSGRSLAVDYRPPSSGGTTGLCYEAMLANVFKTLANLSEFVPGYTVDRGYEILGFAWHQGRADGNNATMTAEYEFNLANLIRDVRTDLGIPRLPISIGVTGTSGWHPEEITRNQIVEAQLAVANATKYPEFQGTVASVETRDFYREPFPASPGDDIRHWYFNCESYWLVGQAMGKAMVDLIQNKEVPAQGHENTKRKSAFVDEAILRGRNRFRNGTIQ